MPGRAWAKLVVRRRWIAAGAALAVLGRAVVAATSIHLDSANGDPNTLSQPGHAKAGLNALERSGIGDGVLTPIEISHRGRTPRAWPSGWPISRGCRVRRRRQRRLAARRPGRWSSTSSRTATQARPSTASGVAAHAAGAGVRVGGLIAQNDDFICAVYGSFPLMIGVIALLTFVLLARAFRSLLLPLKAVVLNVVSVGAAWGVLTLVWQHGYGSQAIWGIPASGSIPSWLPLIAFAFLFGLSMDYEVFILARIREEYDATASTDTAVVRGIGRTGRLVTSAALIMFLGFLAMASAPNTQVKMIATGLGAGIILDATLVRAMLVPAAVSLFGRWNWWLPSLRRASYASRPPAP